MSAPATAPPRPFVGSPADVAHSLFEGRAGLLVQEERSASSEAGADEPSAVDPFDLGSDGDELVEDGGRDLVVLSE